MASTKETISGVPQPAGMELALPALDAEILTQVRALNRYPKRGKDKAENLLAVRISKRWLDLLPSTREELEALQKYGKVQKLLEELRNFGREPKKWRKPATPAQKYESLLANRFSLAKHRGKLTSSQVEELKAIWASNSGGSSEGGRGIKRQCEEDRNSGGQHSAVTKPVAHASSGDRPQAKRPCQEKHGRMPP